MVLKTGIVYHANVMTATLVMIVVQLITVHRETVPVEETAQTCQTGMNAPVNLVIPVQLVILAVVGITEEVTVVVRIQIMHVNNSYLNVFILKLL